MVEYAKNKGLPVLASNAPKSIVICVGKEGPELLDRLPETDRGWAASELHLDEGAYLDKYRSFVMSNASHGSGSSDSDADEEMAKRMESMRSEERRVGKECRAEGGRSTSKKK